MIEQFITWEMLRDFALLTGIVLTATQFIKNLPLIVKVPTKYVAWFVAFILIILTNIQSKDFQALDIVLYALSAMFVSTSANGIHDMGKKKEVEQPEEEVEGVGSVIAPTILNEEVKSSKKSK